MRRWFRVAARRGLLAALLLAALGGRLPARAQEQEALRFEDVKVGFDGVVRRGTWFPITVTVSNDGPDVQGELVWQDEDSVFRRAIELPRGARKRVSLLALDQRNFQNKGSLSIRVGAQRLLEAPVRQTFVDDDVFVIGVIGDDPALLNSLASLRLPDWSRVVLVRLSADEVPEQWVGLAMLNVLFVGAPGSELWSEGTRKALESWVGLGGQLVIGGGLNADRIAAGLGDLSPVELGTGLSEADLGPLQAFAGSNKAVEPTRAGVRAAQPRPGARTLIEGPLLVAQQRGAGRTLFAAFDLATLRGWSQEPQFWQKALAAQPLFDLGAVYRRSNDNLLQNGLQLPGLGLPSAWLLLGYLLLYVLLVGPANFVILRRLDRREWAWLTVPLTVLVFALGTYALGFGVRGGSVLLNQITVVQSYEGATHAPATVFMGMFSPRRTSYSLDLPSDAVASDLSSTGGGGQVAPLLRADGLRLEDVLVDVGSLRTILVESDLALPFQVRSNLRQGAASVEGDLRIEGGAVQQALVVQGESAVLLGDISAGQQQPVRLTLGSSNFPWSAGLSSAGIFNRQQVLNSLFSSNRFASWPGTSRPGTSDGTYLLAWAERPGVDVSVAQGGTNANGLTLYVVRLQTTP